MANEYKGCEWPICDYCVHYQDYSGERIHIHGMGMCAVFCDEVSASGGGKRCVDHFVCYLCLESYHRNGKVAQK